MPDTSNCCNAQIIENTDICAQCGEHCFPLVPDHDEEPEPAEQPVMRPVLVAKMNAYQNPVYLEAVKAIQPGIEIEGNGTCPHPLSVKLSGAYAVAPELLEALQGIVELENRTRVTFDPADAETLWDLLHEGFAIARAAIAKATTAALLLLLFTLPAVSQTPASQPGFELEYMLQITDSLGQIRFDTLRGTEPVEIADLLRNGEKLPDISQEYDLFLYSKSRGLVGEAKYPATHTVLPLQPGFYRLEVHDRENQIAWICQFSFRWLPGGWWEVICLATPTEF